MNDAAVSTGIPRIGDPAPSFTAVTTQGEITFPSDYAGSWVIFFSHPADFTPVCTSEFMTFASMEDEFTALNTKLVGLSIDGLYSHIAWLRTIKDKIEFKGMKDVEVTFPLIEDITMEIARKYGMIMPGEDSTKAVRAVFVVDPQGIIRTIIYYPLSLGRNFDELKRVIIALQTADALVGRDPRRLAPRRRRHRPDRRLLRHRQGTHGRQGGKRHLRRLVLLHQGRHKGSSLRGHHQIAEPQVGDPPIGPPTPPEGNT